MIFGSHLDTVNNGGMFDGAVGVLAGIEAIKRIKEQNVSNKRDIEVVVYSGEEGSSFDCGLLGSSVISGKLTYERALEFVNNEGEKLKDILKRIQYYGDFKKDLKDVKYSLEMHVE